MSALLICPVDHDLLTLQDCYWPRMPVARRTGTTARRCPLCGTEIQRTVRPGAVLRASLRELFCYAPHARTRTVLELLCDWLCKHVDPATPERVETDPAPALDDLRDFGLRIRARRERAGLSRSQLAKRVGICDATLRNVETARHRPSASVIARLMQAPELRDDPSDPSLR